MNKNLALILVLILFITLNLVNAEDITGNSPIINITNITHFERFNNLINKSYYSFEKIEITSEVYDQEGWTDIFSATLTLDNVTLDCQKTNIIDNNTAEYFCSLTILSWMKGEYNLSLIVTDNGGLTATAFVGNYYFNPNMSLNKDNINFSQLIMGNESETGWINVSVNTPTDNHYKVLLSGKDLYAEQECYEKEVCINKKVCEEVNYKNRTQRKNVCVDIPYNGTKSKRICEKELINGKLKIVCERVYYNVTKYKRSCHYETYQKLYYKKICQETCTLRNITICDLKNCGGNNYLSLSNFDYQLENSTWKNVQNIDNKEIVYLGIKGNGNFTIKFKAKIPDICYGNYTLDGSNLFLELHE